jgi:hypothetical protein
LWSLGLHLSKEECMRRTFVLVVSLLLGIFLAAPAVGQSSIGGSDGSDDKVTGQAYVRHDGGTDAGIEHCNDPASNPAEDDDADDDVDSNDGGRPTSRSRSSTRRTQTPWWPAGTTTA